MVKRYTKTKTRKSNIKKRKKTRVLRGGSITWNQSSYRWEANPNTESNRAQADFWNQLAG